MSGEPARPVDEVFSEMWAEMRRQGIDPTQPIPSAPPKPFLSEGIRQELEERGRARDYTGGWWVKDADTGKVTYTDPAGNTIEP